ncbi:MAG: TOBE domain-containing protein [Gammaproteobacteria bacterium]|nr:TOBE domain-containing protein [Gammaproteobacteria bacterium]
MQEETTTNPLLACITRKSAAALILAPAQKLYAQIKAVSLL